MSFYDTLRVGDLLGSSCNRNHAWRVVEKTPDKVVVVHVREDGTRPERREVYTYTNTGTDPARDVKEVERLAVPAELRFWVVAYGQSARVLTAIDEGKVANLGHERLSA